tara:strand:- start:1441 stop:3027 length:1587 start_codon:yes stop_codon:yes gene_type:complete
MFKFKRIKTLSISIFCLLLTLFQSSCKTNIQSRRITIASAGRIDSLDPARANTLKALQIISALGDTLYELNNEGKLIPNLASKMPIVSDDKLKISIRLKENIFFHDGTPFDSNAMKFTIERFQRIGTNNYILDKKIKSITTPDKNTLIIYLNKPTSSIEGLLTSINLTAISPIFYKNYTDKFLNDNFVGTGEYVLKSFSNEIQILDPNLNYWDDKPKNQGINFVGYSNSSSLYGALKSKQIDVLLSNSIDDDQRKDLSVLSKNKKINEGRSSPTEISFIALRTNIEPLNKKEIRIAIAKTFNRKEISKKVSYGLRDPSISIVPQIFKGNNLVSWPLYNPKEAISILQNEGYCKGKTLNLPLTYRSNVPTDKLIALYWKQDVQTNMQDCLSISITGVESTTVYKNLSKGLYTAVILDWTGIYSDPEAYLAPLLSCNKIDKDICNQGESVYSGSFWGSNKIEKLFLESGNLYGNERLKILLNIERLASEAIPYIPIWFSSQKAWSQKNISKPVFNGAGRILMGDLELIDE